MRFVCLGYMDEAKWNAMSEAEQATFIDNRFAYDDELRRGGHFVGGEAAAKHPNGPPYGTATEISWVTDGPFAETKEYLGGHHVPRGPRPQPRDPTHVQASGSRTGAFEIRPTNEELKAASRRPEFTTLKPTEHSAKI